MRFGLLLTSVHDRSVPASQQIAEHRELISAAVDHGFDLVVAGQHFAAPTLRYLQPVPYLTSIAMTFPSVSVATGVLLLPLLHPVGVAEEMATMDALTGGRTIMGVGIGYRQDEFDAFGIDRTTRTERFEESLKIIRALWTGQPLTHHGRYFQLDNVELSALPVQQPNPPIWVGAQVEASVRRAARVGDAWYAAPFPSNRELIDLYQVYLEERADQGNRALAAVPVRREVYIANSPADAEAVVSAGASSRYSTYRTWGLDVDDGLGRSDWLDNRFVLGSPSDVAERLSHLMDHVDHSHFIYKPQWPGHDHAHAMAQLERFGTEVIPLLSG
ncbi:MAG: LLM class flavin-dependent oxidoreductase [bacterium]|nr:LLM class flavin-dependent oxidoreductase [bacterium]